MDQLCGLGTGQFSQLLASALDAGEGPASHETIQAFHGPTSSSPVPEADLVSQQHSSVERMKGTVHAHLSSQLTSDFIEGLRPVMHNGQLQISTYIPLQGELEPAFIGNFPSIHAAVHAQRQSHALVCRLPGAIARKLIAAQLANTLGAPAAAAGAALGTDAKTTATIDTAPVTDKGQPGDTATDAVKLPSDAAAAAAFPTAPAPAEQVSTQQQEAQRRQEANGVQQSTAAALVEATSGAAEDASVTTATAQAAVPTAQPVDAGTAPAPVPEAAAATADGSTPITDAAAAGAPPKLADAAPDAPAAAEAAAAAAGGSVQPLSALTDDVINLLLRKGLHALSTVAGSKDGEGNEWQQQQDGEAAAAQAVGPETQGVTTPADPAAAAASVGFIQAQYIPSATSEALAAAGIDLQQLQQQMQGYSTVLNADMAGVLLSTSAAAPAGTVTVDGVIEYAAPHTGQQYRAASHLPPRPALQGPWDSAAAAAAAGVPAGGPAAAAGTIGAFALYPGAFPAGVFPQEAYNMTQGDVLGRRPRTSSASDAAYWSDYNAAMYGAPAATQATSSGDTKRKRSDPRLNCIKSVQYRVSRFPSELHDSCLVHWERTRCARVVCNNVNGVMSVQGGRCVVSFTQHGQEVLKGVADYLRYAGEDRIKKWRRHVRMVDFPRPNNRTGELMTAEEFLCVVGYQSEQGGGKRPKYMNGGAAGEAGGDSD